MIRMKHPLHGWHHAHNKNEEAYLRKLGWSEDEPALVLKALDKQPEPQHIAPAIAPDQPVKRGPGRPRKG